MSAHVPANGGGKLPLSALSELETHVHGELVWTIGDRRVPGMGFFGPDDVCLGDWWDDLTSAVSALGKGEAYTIDSYEQGEPAFRFEREGPTVYLTIIAGGGGGPSNKHWQREAIAWQALVSAVDDFKRAVVKALEPVGLRSLPTDWQRRVQRSESPPL